MRNGLLSIAKNGSFHKSNNRVCFWWKDTVAPCEPRKQHIEYEREANSMRKVVVFEFVTLDGVIEDPGGAEGFKHGGWSFQFGSAEQQQFKVEELFKADALLLGRVTYQGFAAAWPTMPGTGAYGERMNSLPKHVVSTTLTDLEWNNSRLINRNVADEVSKLKQQPGQDIIVFGSRSLVHTLM